MIFLKIIWKWVVRQIMSFVNFVLKQELDRQKKEFEDAKKESDNAVIDFESALSDYRDSQETGLSKSIGEVRSSGGKTEEDN